MQDKEFIILGCVSFLVFLFGSTLYFPIQFALYQPYFNVGWQKSECLVQNIENYRILWYTDDQTGETFYAKYSLIHVLVDINGVMRRGFACGSNLSNIGSGENGFDYKYPYQYGDCPFPNQCGAQMIMPMWFCSDCQSCEHLKQEEKQDCWWFLKDDEGIVQDVDDLPIGYQPDIPLQSEVFIQASFREQPYYKEGEYLTLQIMVLGLLMILPGLVTVCCCAGGVIKACLNR